MTAHYNTLYNGQVAFLEGSEAQNKGHKDNFNEILPMYICTNKSTAGMGKSNFETAITKCEKAIKVHSIKKRPTTNGNKKRTEKEKEFLARREFNPYMYRAWLMMADAQFRKGEFFEAASTYNYILRLYSSQPDITSVARARLARCYVALNWPYDAEDLLNKMKRDSITRKGLIEFDNTKAGYYVLTRQYQEAIPHLKNAIKSTKGKVPKARLNFLLGQLYHETGRDTMAYKALAKVIRANPPYEIAFNARIMQTEVM
ncbi:MAG: tetratricopeptide repeat protein, partial [Bacteroidaceae bacterium]|nr:tetratricopeptide repeat protein [Bacteroidaceae bacterium]